VIINERPPNFEQVHAAFPRADQPGVLFAYYPNIHNPSGIVVPPALVAHEEVHLHRQRDAGPTKWWDQYLTDSEFRYNEELLAHAAEFRHQKHSDRNASARLLLSTALRLVAPLYKYQPPRSLAQAIKDLKREIAKP
jgi:hypothetical protein